MQNYMTFYKNSRPFNANQIILTLEKFQKFLHHISQHICNICNAVTMLMPLICSHLYIHLKANLYTCICTYMRIGERYMSDNLIQDNFKIVKGRFGVLAMHLIIMTIKNVCFTGGDLNHFF